MLSGKQSLLRLCSEKLTEMLDGDLFLGWRVRVQRRRVSRIVLSFKILDYKVTIQLNILFVLFTFTVVSTGLH